MITIIKANSEIRSRDLKRKRLLLSIGDKEYHITREEAISIRDQINKAIVVRKRRF